MVVWASPGPVWHSKVTLVLQGPLQVIILIWTRLFRNSILFSKYFSPLKLHTDGSVFTIYICISIFGSEKQFGKLFLGSWDIKHIQKVHLFKTLCILLPSSVPVAVPVKFNWTEIVLISPKPPTPPTRARYFQFTQEAEIRYAS